MSKTAKAPKPAKKAKSAKTANMAKKAAGAKKAKKADAAKKAKKAKKQQKDKVKKALGIKAIQTCYEEKQPKNRTYTVRCTEEDLQKWRLAAEQKEVSLSALITSLLEIYCD